MNTLESNEQQDIFRYKTDIDEIRSILSKLSNFDLKFGNSLPQPIKNQKADVTQLFFQLIELFSTYFEISTLPRDYSRIFFACFTTLHHFAVDLYCSGISHSDTEFTTLWKNFSWLFKSLQQYIFPSDYNYIIDQITQELVPLHPRLNEQIPEEKDISTIFRKFKLSVNNLQDPLITFDCFKTISSDFMTLKALIRKFCQRIDLIPPHLFNALSLTEYILYCISYFIRIRETIKAIDLKVQESFIISIHLESNDYKFHRRFLNSSIKLNQVENRLIYSKVLEITQYNYLQNPNTASQDIQTKIQHHYFLSTTLLMHFFAIFGIYRDNQLLLIWKKYTQASFLNYVDSRGLLQSQKPSSQNGANPRNRTTEKIILANFTSEISLIDRDSNIFSLYEEFIRIYGFIEHDQSHRALRPLSHCVILLLKIISETDSEGVKNSTMKVIDMIVSHLIVSKAHDDLKNFENIIKIMNEQKRKFEQQQKQYQMMQLPQPQSQQQQQIQQQQISSSLSNSNLSLNSSSNSETNLTSYQSSNQNESMHIHQSLLSIITPNESSYQSLLALYDRTLDIMKPILQSKQNHLNEWQILTNYQDYLDLLIAISAPRNGVNNGDGQIPVNYLEYHPNPDQIADCLNKFFIDFVNEMLPFSSTVPPVIFSSYPPNEEKLATSDMQRIARLLLTERRKEYNAQLVVLEFSKVSIYIEQVKAFLGKFQKGSLLETNLAVDICFNQKLSTLASNLIKLKKGKSLFCVEESRELAEAIFPLLIKSMYKKYSQKIRLDTSIYKLIKSLYVPRCSDNLRTCYMAIECFDSVLSKIPALNQQVSELKSFLYIAFNRPHEIQKFNQSKLIIEKILKELKDVDPRLVSEITGYLESYEKFITLCHLLNLITKSFKEYKLDPDEQISIDRREEFDNQNDNDTESTKNNGLEPVDKEPEPRRQQNDPYDMPYISILVKVNHISLIRQKLIEAKKLNLLCEPEPLPEQNPTESLDEFSRTLVEEIDDTLATNKFIYINNSKLNEIIDKFNKRFDITIVLKNLVNYFEEWASYLRNVNEMSTTPELVVERNLKYMKAQLNDSLNNTQLAIDRIYKTIIFIKKRSLDLQKDVKTIESVMIQNMCYNYSEKALIVYNLLILLKYPSSLELGQLTATPIMPTFTASSQPALSQIQHIRYQQGTSSTTSLPIYFAKSQQQQQQGQSQPQTQPQQIVQLAPQIQNLQKYQQQQQQKIQSAIQFTQNLALSAQPNQILQGPKFSIAVPMLMNTSQPHLVLVTQPPQQSAASEAAQTATQRLFEMARLAQELPHSQSVTSLTEKCKELMSGNFPRIFSVITTITPEATSNMQLSELKTLKSSLQSSLCKLESSSKKKELLSLNEHFGRCLSLIDQQTRIKDETIDALAQTIEGLEEKLGELEMQMPRDEAAPPEIMSALDSILEDDMLVSMMGDNGLIALPQQMQQQQQQAVADASGSGFSRMQNSADNAAAAAAASSASSSTPAAATTSASTRSGSRRRGKQRSRNSSAQQSHSQHQQEEASSNANNAADSADQSQVSNTADLISSSSSFASISSSSSSSILMNAKPSAPKKPASSSVVNMLLVQVKNAEILNKRLHRKIERLQFPSSTEPLSQDQFTAAYPLNLDTYEGCSWIASSVKESSSSRNELSKLQDERNSLFEQMIRANQSKSMPLKREMVENLYSSLVSSCSSASSSNSSNGKVSKQIILNFIEKSDNFFTYVDYDIQAMKKKLKILRSQNRMTPAEHVAQFTKQLQSLE